jgi:hypothetical protein
MAKSRYNKKQKILGKWNKNRCLELINIQSKERGSCQLLTYIQSNFYLLNTFVILGCGSSVLLIQSLKMVNDLITCFAII